MCAPTSTNTGNECLSLYAGTDYALAGCPIMSYGWSCYDGTTLCQTHSAVNSPNYCDQSGNTCRVGVYELPGSPAGGICQTTPGGCDDRYSPLVIRTSHGRWKFSNTPVSFDMTGDGVPETVSWTAAGAEIAFLARDLNGNKKVDGILELFGNYDGTHDHREWNGFKTLAVLDSNHDGLIDHQDTAWESLLLWVDRNHDGVSQPEELSRLDASDITALDLDYRFEGRHDESVALRYAAKLWRGHAVDTYFDAYFFSPGDGVAARKRP